ncbi:MAG: YceI family protein [Bacteroidetes bacterium]|nr:YceI family protein [Bacteroidota bacterium]
MKELNFYPFFKIMRFWLFSLFYLFTSLTANSQVVGKYSIVNGTIEFTSMASLETIKASSKELKGLIDPATHSVAFRVANNSFLGFNSQLQRDHFNENYMEADLFSNCTFSGKIIDEVDFNKDGKYPVRAKGVLNIKGISQERIIKGVIYIKGAELFLTSEFLVSLSDHDIRIPRIVQQKIAPEIEVSLTAKMKVQK